MGTAGKEWMDGTMWMGADGGGRDRMASCLCYLLSFFSLFLNQISF